MPIRDELLTTIREENLNVYRASPQRLREDVGQENQIAQDYRGRLIFELLQNADDAMASQDTSTARVRFMLTDDALWVGNSGRPLDEADVRGLCGISASSKVGTGQKRRATIGHKGMGFKSVLEITEAPEVYSTTISFRFGPNEALRAVQALVDAGVVPSVRRAPVTRFPWAIKRTPAEWDEMRLAGMHTAFCFPLRDKMTDEQRIWLADALISVPVTTLIFLKHFHRIEFVVLNRGKRSEMAWTVTRERLTTGDTRGSHDFETGVYRVVLKPDQGDPLEFLLAHDGDIPIDDKRSGLDEFSWEGIEYTEVSVAVRLERSRPIPLDPAWRKFHIFLPSSEPCPYGVLISGAFNSNLSRQEVRIEPDRRNYNRFLLRQVARLLRDQLLPSLLQRGATVGEVLRLLDRGVQVGTPAATGTGQALYEEVRTALQHVPFVPQEVGSPLAPATCVVPPMVRDKEVGRDFRAVLPPQMTFAQRSFPAAYLCGSDTAHVLVDLGARTLEPGEASAVLEAADKERSRAWPDTERGVMTDPILSILERLWAALASEGRDELTLWCRQRALFPVSISGDGTVHRIAPDDLECFYPPRSLGSEVPLSGLCFLARDLCWGALTPRERNILLRDQMEAWHGLFGIREFKFPDVMRASVLPALELDPAEGTHARKALHDMNRLAAICQLTGRTPTRTSPLPYERLGPNRALFNLSRIDVPCHKYGSTELVWMPAYRVYFSDDWVGNRSIEWVLLAAEEMPGTTLEVYMLLESKAFMGLLDQYRHLKGSSSSDESDVGEDEVSLDEDEEAALDADDRTRWFEFFSWLGVNSSMRPVHFHDVEDRASGWLRTEGLRRPDGWAFRTIPDTTWEGFVQGVQSRLRKKDPARFDDTVPYFYQLHDLEHRAVLLKAARRDKTAQVGRALYEHLARNWDILERFARLQVAQVPLTLSPTHRTKPPKAYDQELTNAGDNFWVRHLQVAAFCPTGHGPRPAYEVWHTSLEVQRRFGYQTHHNDWQYLIPVLDVDPVLTHGKGRTFAHALRMREDLTPANFTIEDARVVLSRLQTLYADHSAVRGEMRLDLREIIRPAYRGLLELLTNRAPQSGSPDEVQPPLADAPLLAQNGLGMFRFARAQEIFYTDRRETRDRLQNDEAIWTFVIEAFPAARAPLAQLFGMPTLEDSLVWMPVAGELSLIDEELKEFRTGLWSLGPYLLACPHRR